MTAEQDGLDLEAITDPVRGYLPETLEYRLAALALELQGKVAGVWDEGARAATMDYGIGKVINPYRKA